MRVPNRLEYQFCVNLRWITTRRIEDANGYWHHIWIAEVLPAYKRGGGLQNAMASLPSQGAFHAIRHFFRAYRFKCLSQSEVESTGIIAIKSSAHTIELLVGATRI